jgi:hypothetical protein
MLFSYFILVSIFTLSLKMGAVVTKHMLGDFSTEIRTSCVMNTSHTLKSVGTTVDVSQSVQSKNSIP